MFSDGDPEPVAVGAGVVKIHNVQQLQHAASLTERGAVALRFQSDRTRAVRRLVQKRVARAGGKDHPARDSACALEHGQTLCEQAEQALQGGATFLQLREKELDEAHFKEEAVALKALCRQYGVPFVLDDNVALAIETDADGVHVGQSDMAAGKVRALIGPDKILGVSAQTVEDALLAEREGADYLGVGAVFPTGTKTDANAVSYDTLREICAAVSIPVIAIGGITRDNVAQLSGSGIVGVAVVSAIFAQPDIPAATRALKTAVRAALEL